MKVVSLKRVILYFNMVLCGLAAFYLMRWIDQITLTTSVQRIFVWCYFTCLLILLILIIKRPGDCYGEYRIMCFVVIGVFLTLAYKMRAFEVPKKYLQNNIVVSISAQNNIKSMGREVWIKSVSCDGKNQSLMSYEKSNNGWECSENALRGIYENSQELELILPKAKKIEIDFGMHQWSGIVEIKKDSFDEVFDLYDIGNNEKVVTIIGSSENYDRNQRVILLLGLYAIVCISCEVLLILVKQRQTQKN